MTPIFLVFQYKKRTKLNRRKCIALFQGHKPAPLNKLAPEELPDYKGLETCRVIDYVPEWKRREEESEREAKERKEKERAAKTQPPVSPPAQPVTKKAEEDNAPR